MVYAVRTRALAPKPIKSTLAAANIQKPKPLMCDSNAVRCVDNVRFARIIAHIKRAAVAVTCEIGALGAFCVHVNIVHISLLSCVYKQRPPQTPNAPAMYRRPDKTLR